MTNLEKFGGLRLKYFSGRIASIALVYLTNIRSLFKQFALSGKPLLINCKLVFLNLVVYLIVGDGKKFLIKDSTLR